MCIFPAEIGIKFGEFASWCADAFLVRTEGVLAERNIIFLSQSAEISAEGYEIRIDEKRIDITASSEQGVIWALTTRGD